jgi:23S rRNA pseudouridine1911/1915/1917 synthase
MNQPVTPDLEPESLAGERVERSAVIPVQSAGWRFDRAVGELFPEWSRSRMKAWIEDGQLLLDGKIARPRDLVRGGETVTVTAMLDPQVESAPEDIPLDIVYEDEHVLVVNKPAGLVVHPGAGNATGTLQNALLHYDAQLALIPRAGIVHRLDKDTSGLMIVARTTVAHARLVEQISERDVHRQYEALVAGALIAGGTIDQPIERHPRERIKMAVREDGRHAVTHYRVRERFRAHTLLQVNLETGRTHQIRVHLAHLRHALVGDPLYGTGLKLPKGATAELTTALRAFKRQALHAEKLAFQHPVEDREVSCVAPRPADMAELLLALRADEREAQDRER